VPIIQLDGVSKRYGDRTALHETDLSVETGEVVALIGPSGCGKSTLLRLILGLIEPTSGRVVVDGTEVRPQTAIEIRRKVGYVVQEGGLFPHLTARGNVTLMAKHLGRDVPLERLAELTRFPLDGLDRFLTELSGGQRQRVGLMRALALDPDLLLMDEPLGALDPLVRAALQSDLRDLFRELKKTVVFVTHDLAEAVYLGSRIVLLNAGRIVQTGTLADLQDRPADPFVTEFINAQRGLVFA
jgi:osmoprotectant transport system ATP-binding protein